MKNILKLTYASVLGLTLLSGANVVAVTNPAATNKPNALFADPVVAKGTGFEIRQSEVENTFIDYKANMASRGNTVTEGERSNVESNLLQRLVITKVLMGRATEEDKKKASEGTDKLVANAKKEFPNEEMFVQQLKATGISPEQFRTRAYEQTLCEVVIQREVKANVNITEEQAKKFYDENPARFERPETVRVAHILISTVEKNSGQPLPAAKKKEQEQLAKRLKERAAKGEDFGKLAKEFSEDPGSKAKDGELPPFARGELGVPEFETAAFSLKTNQVSDVVETRLGFHVIKLLQKIPPEKVEFAKVLPDLKEGLAQQETQKLVPEYFEKIKKEAKVEIIGEEKREKKLLPIPLEKPPAK